MRLPVRRAGALSEHNRHVRFTLPEAVLALPERERTAGVWLAIDPTRLEVFGVLHSPAYADLNLGGWLANAIPPWGLLAAPAERICRRAERLCRS